MASAALPGQLTPLRLMLWGLTRREQEVVKEMLRGSSTRGIAETLSVAPGTVQDHLTAAFDKVGVRSRRELSALLTAPDPGEGGSTAQTGRPHGIAQRPADP